MIPFPSSNSPSQLTVIPPSTDALDDPLFAAGQRADAFALADKGTGDTPETFVPDWDDAFLQTTQEIHGVLLVAGDSFETVSAKLEDVKKIFNGDADEEVVKEVATLAGDVRPGKEKGHEQ